MHTTRSPFLARSLHIFLLASLAFVPLAGGGVSARQAGASPLDLPAMTLRPADLADEGVEDFGSSFSVLADDADEVGEWVAYADIDPGSDDAAAYVEADAERYYILDLDNSVPDEEWAYYTKVVETFILAYDDEDAAEDGLDAMEAVWGDSDTLVSGNLTEEIGDNAFYFEGEGVDNVSGEATERTLLVFQVDNLVAGILTYNSDVDGTFDQDTTEALGLRLQERVADGLAGDTPGLGMNIVRFDVPAINSWYDRYMTIDGDTLCTSDASAAGECDTFQQLVDDFNEVDRYSTYGRIAGDFEAGAPESYLQTSLRTFEDEDSAELRFEEMAESRPNDPTDVQDLDLGDESIRWSESNESFMYEFVLVRSGNAIIEMTQSTEYALADGLGWTFEPSPDAVYETAELQIACLDGEASCAEPVELPDGMLPAEALPEASPEGVSTAPFVSSTRRAA